MASHVRRGMATSRVQQAAVAVAVAFLVVGIGGFVPGLTTNFDAISFAGHRSEALLLGIFQVSILHNLVHVLFGVAGLALARSVTGAANYLVGGGVIYLLLWLYGLVVDAESTANVVPLNDADDWLHLVLAVGMILLAVVLGRRLAGGRSRGSGD